MWLLSLGLFVIYVESSYEEEQNVLAVDGSFESALQSLSLPKNIISIAYSYSVKFCVLE
jgi:hypothetical protein